MYKPHLSSFLPNRIGRLFYLFICLSYNFFIPVHAENRALIVGINEYQNIQPLRGSVVDAQKIQQLVKKLDVYQANQIRLLTDAQATRQGILDGLDWLANGSQPGDNVFFYYSGHGAQVVDTHNDEPDGFEETLCPVGTTLTRKGMITDDEINERLQRLTGRYIVIVIDSCHSGTITKGNLPKGIQLKTPTFTIPLPETKGIRKGISSEPLINAAAQGKTVVFTAVASNQLAIDTGEGGIFTSSFIKAIEDRGGKISNRELLEITRRDSETACQLFSSAARLGLTPQLEVSTSSLEEAVIFPMNSPRPSLPTMRPLLSLNILPGEILRLGDNMRFTITSQQAGHLVIYDIDSEGKITAIFPDANSGRNTGYISAGQTLTIPDVNDSFDFKVGLPTGKGMVVVALASNEAIARQIKRSFEGTKGLEHTSKSRAQEVATQVKGKLVGILGQEAAVFLKAYEIVGR